MLTINSVNNYNPSFSAFRHELKNKSGDVLNRGDTCMFRYDLYYDYFVNFIRSKYRNIPKVKFLVQGCSDGEEVYSLLSKMVDMLGLKNSEKFLPIIAMDKEQDYINLAEKAKYNIESFEEGAIGFYLGNHFDNYFIQLGKKTFTPNYTMKKNVIFVQGNIIDCSKHIDFSNTVMLARNLWPYLSEEEQEELAQTLSIRMDKSSTLVIGDYDKENGIDILLYNHGFRELFNLKNVYEKIVK